MYKLLLSWRYLLTRYIALASIISVTLGVATMIVVNSVMFGFTTELEQRAHGILSDVIFEASSAGGFPDPEAHMEKIRQVAGDMIDGMTPTVVIPAMLSFRVGNSYHTRPVEMVGIDAATQGDVSEMAEFLQHPANRESFDFELRQSGYDDHNYQAGEKAVLRPELREAGWEYRRSYFAEMEKYWRRMEELNADRGATIDSPTEEGESVAEEDNRGIPTNPFAAAGAEQEQVFDPAKEQHAGVILGIGLTAYGRREIEDEESGQTHFEEGMHVIPGDDVTLTFPNADTPPEGVSDKFTVVDLYESKMVEYDSKLVFVPLSKLQELRGMYEPETGRRWVSQILIKSKPGTDLNQLRDQLREAFPPEYYIIETWRDRQETLLSAIFTEVAILNVLLFLIIAVAGFGILAIFFMIVVEKTRDIGILKSLGAGGSGIMQIFLTYSLSLGLFGSGIGLILGLLFVHYINEIASFLSMILGHNVFDPRIYSFYEIPTIVNPLTITWIVAGAIFIAVAAGVLPALRAARMHPVEALRYE